jgi:hypothetical protein
MTVPVAEDVTVGPSFPDSVFPDVNDLAVEAADNQAYLKFVVPAIPGKIKQARLVMRTSTDPSANGSGGEVYPVADDSWSEATLTWNQRPTPGTTSLGRIGPAGVDEIVFLDLGAAVAGPGTHSFAVVSPATDANGTHFFSKEGSATGAAYLKLSYDTLDGDGDGTPDGPDCDDADPAVGPGSAEACNAKDDDCDGTVDEGCGSSGTGGTGGGGSGAGSSLDPNVQNEEDAPAGCACGTERRAVRWPLSLWALAAFAARRRRARR